MSPAITFYTHPMSRGRAARWMLEETGLPYDEVILDWNTSMKSPEYLAINPMGKVPAIRHGDAVVTENAAIALYLGDLVPERRLAPSAGSPERAPYYRWMSFMSGPAEYALDARRTGYFAPAIGAGYGQPDDTLETLRNAVKGKTHLAGDHFTMVDLYVAGYLGFFMRIGALPRLPEFEAFATPHLERPACVAAAARDDALAAEHPAAPVAA